MDCQYGWRLFLRYKAFELCLMLLRLAQHIVMSSVTVSGPDRVLGGNAMCFTDGLGLLWVRASGYNRQTENPKYDRFWFTAV